MCGGVPLCTCVGTVEERQTPTHMHQHYMSSGLWTGVFFTHSSALHYIHSYLLHTCWSYVYFMHSGLKKHWSHLLWGQMISSTYTAAFDCILSAQISFYNKSHPPVTHTLIAAFHTHSHTNRCTGSNKRFSIMPKIYWSTCRQPALPPDPQPFPKLKLI